MHPKPVLKETESLAYLPCSDFPDFSDFLVSFPTQTSFVSGALAAKEPEM